jgi:hypothetical protein
LHQYPSDIYLSISLRRYVHDYVTGELIMNGGVDVAGLQLKNCRLLNLKASDERHVASFAVGTAKMDITLDEDKLMD